MVEVTEMKMVITDTDILYYIMWKNARKQLQAYFYHKV